MADTQLIARHPLAESATHGIEMPGANHLELVETARIHAVLAFKGQESKVSAVAAQLPAGMFRNVGPGEWLIVSADPSQVAEIAGAMVVDQSNGRTLFRLTGPDAIRILMKGVGIDIAGGGFPVGASSTTAFGHLTINLARVESTNFEIIGMRSFAESLHHDLRQAGREFGLSFAVTQQ